jgi:hypothetical protein
MVWVNPSERQASLGHWDRPNAKGEEDGIHEVLRLGEDPISTTSGGQSTISTPYAVPLTTVFTPHVSCNQNRLTMLSSPGYFIWLNEPVPVPGTTISDCYPPEFMKYYTTYLVNPMTIGSLVPLMSPLVCPFGWQVVSKRGDYQACCPSGYDFTPPQTTLDPNRPAYGGTCYSEWHLSSSTYVEVYGSTSSSGSKLVTASTSGFANYAHVIDGIAVPTLSEASSTTSSSQSSSKTSVGPGNIGDPTHTVLSPGAIAGIVVGVVVATGLFTVGAYLLIRYRRQRSIDTPPASPLKDESPTRDVIDAALAPDICYEMPTRGSDVYELDARSTPIEKP